MGQTNSHQLDLFRNSLKSDVKFAQTIVVETKFNLIENDSGWNALMIAIDCKNEVIARSAIAAGADCDKISSDGFVTPLLLAVQNEMFTLVPVILAKSNGTSIYVTNEQGNNVLQLPLKIKTMYDSLNLVIERFPPGNNIDASNFQLETVLILACKLGKKELVKTLLTLGANTSMRDSFGKSARDYALMFNFENIIDTMPQYISIATVMDIPVATAPEKIEYN